MTEQIDSLIRHLLTEQKSFILTDSQKQLLVDALENYKETLDMEVEG